jgi:hypothetical protein
MKKQNLAEPTVHREMKTGAEIFGVAAGCRFPGLVSGRHFNKPAKRSRYGVTRSSNSDRTAKSTGDRPEGEFWRILKLIRARSMLQGTCEYLGLQSLL